MSRESENRRRFEDLFLPRVTRRLYRGTYELQDGRSAHVKSVRLTKNGLRCTVGRDLVVGNLVVGILDGEEVWVWPTELLGGREVLTSPVLRVEETDPEALFGLYHRYEAWAERSGW